MHINAQYMVFYILWLRFHSKFDHYLDTMEIMVSRNYTQILPLSLGVHRSPPSLIPTHSHLS